MAALVIVHALLVVGVEVHRAVHERKDAALGLLEVVGDAEDLGVRAGLGAVAGDGRGDGRLGGLLMSPQTTVE